MEISDEDASVLAATVGSPYTQSSVQTMYANDDEDSIATFMHLLARAIAAMKGG